MSGDVKDEYTDLIKSGRSSDNSLCHATKTPLHDEGRDLVLHLPRLGVLRGRLGEHCKDLSQPAIAEREEKNQTMRRCPLVVTPSIPTLATT